MDTGKDVSEKAKIRTIDVFAPVDPRYRERNVLCLSSGRRISPKAFEGEDGTKKQGQL